MSHTDFTRYISSECTILKRGISEHKLSNPVHNIAKSFLNSPLFKDEFLHFMESLVFSQNLILKKKEKSKIVVFRHHKRLKKW